MGMSSSQARLLFITSRLHDVEFKSQQIANQKLRLSDESNKVATDYANALNKTKLMIQNPETGKMQQLSYNAIMSPNGCVGKDGSYLIRNANGKVVISQEVANAIEGSSNINEFIAKLSNTSSSATNNATGGNNNTATSSGRRPVKYTGLSLRSNATSNRFLRTVDRDSLIDNIKGRISGRKFRTIGTKIGTIGTKIGTIGIRGIATNDSGRVETVDNSNSTGGASGTTSTNSLSANEQNFYETLYNAIYPNNYVVISDEAIGKEDYLQFQLEQGNWYVSQKSNDGSFKDLSLSNELFSEETDKTDLAKAEAEYNAATSKINKKDKILDLELKRNDTEHQALTQEYESAKKLISDNIEKSFKMFS